MASPAPVSVVRATITMLTSRNRGKECLEQARRCWRWALAFTPASALAASPDVPELRAVLCKSLQDAQVPRKLGALLAELLVMLGGPQGDVGLVKGVDVAQTYEAALAHQLVPLLLVQGGTATLPRNVGALVAWTGAAVPLPVAQAAFRLMVVLARTQRALLQYATHVKPFENNLLRVLLRAPKVSGGGAGTSFFKSSASVEVTTTELDGRPTAAADPFTVLSQALSYVDDQLLNVEVFALLRPWLRAMYVAPKTTPQEELLTRKLDATLRDGATTYCLRVLAQARLAPEDDANVRFTLRNPRVATLCVGEALRVLDTLCTLDVSLVGRVTPAVRAVVPVTLEALEFQLHHVQQSPAALASALQSFFVSNSFEDPVAAHELLAFCVRNSASLAPLFHAHFPALLKILAWHPLAAVDHVLRLLPLMVAPATYMELLHSVLDLPLLAAALEANSNGGDLPEEALRKGDGGDGASSSSSSMATSSSAAAAAAAAADAPPREDAFHVLYNYLLRNESGIALNMWDGEATFAVLQMFCNSVAVSCRVREAARTAPALLSALCDELLQNGSDAQLEQMTRLLLRRMEQLYPLEWFQERIRAVLENKILAIFHRCPHFVTQLHDLIAAAVRGPLGELTLSLCWVIGEYAAPGTTSFHEPLELLLYERLSMAKLGIAEISEARAQIVTSSVDVTHASRLMLVLVATLTKLAARNQALAGRTALCLSKVLQHEPYFVPVVAERARQSLRLLREPAMAAMIHALQQRDPEPPLSMHVRPRTSDALAIPVYKLE